MKPTIILDRPDIPYDIKDKVWNISDINNNIL